MMVGVRPRLLLLFVSFCAGCREEAPPAPIRPVLSVSVEPYYTESLGRFAGSIQARYESVLGFRVGGRIARRLADIGDRVARGDLLAELDPADQVNTLRAREATLAQVEARYTNARAAAHRQQQLFDRGVGSKSQLEEQLTQLSTVGAAVDQARSAERQARDQLSYSRLYSDYDGVVTAWHSEAGQTVAAGQNVLTLAQPQIREAVFDLPAVLVDRLPADVGFRVSAELTPTVSTTGLIRELAPQADANTRTRRVRLKLDEIPQAFRLGTTISVELSRPVARRSQLPITALLERDGRHLVWVLDTQKLTVALREVEVLGQSAQKVIVGDGLEPGERVVVTGVHSLQPGQRVKFEVDLR